MHSGTSHSSLNGFADVSQSELSVNIPTGEADSRSPMSPFSPTTGLPRHNKDLEVSPKVTIFEGFQGTLHKYWVSFQESMRGLAETPKDIKEEVQYFLRNPSVLSREVQCGLTMAVIIVPEAISFAYMIDMSPTQGLLTSFFISLSCAIQGARPAMLSAAAGSIAAVLMDLAKSNGELSHLSVSDRQQVVFAATLISGAIQILLSWLKLAQYSKLISQATMIGFINALAIYVFMGQLHAFKTCPDPNLKYVECPEHSTRYMSFYDNELYYFQIIFFIAVIINFVFPKIPVVGKLVPATLIAMLVGAFIEHVIFRPLGVHSRTQNETAPLIAEFPSFKFPHLPSGTAGPAFKFGLFHAMVSCLESVATVQTMNEMLAEKVTDSQMNRETFAQGVGNALSGQTGGFGGCGIIGESALNILNGARHRLSAIVASFSLLFILLWVSPLVNYVPMAALAGSIMFVAAHAFHWPTLWTIFRMRKFDAICVVLVTVLAIFTNLAIAMVVGFFISATASVLDGNNAFKISHFDIPIRDIPTNEDFFFTQHVEKVYAYKEDIPNMDVNLLSDINNVSGYDSMSSSTTSTSTTSTTTSASTSSYSNDRPVPANTNIVRVYKMDGLVFFGSSRTLKNHFVPAQDPMYVILDFSDSTLADLSATGSLEYALMKFNEEHRLVKIVGIDRKSEKQLVRNETVLHYLAKVAPGEFRVRQKDEYELVKRHDSIKNNVKRIFRQTDHYDRTELEMQSLNLYNNNSSAPVEEATLRRRLDNVEFLNVG